MDWQQAVALLIVAITGALFVRSKMPSRKFLFKRDTHCGCASSTLQAAPQSVIFRARKGKTSSIELRHK